MSSECCDCLTRYREIEKKATCKLAYDGDDTYDPPAPNTKDCRYTFKPHNSIPRSETVFSDKLALRKNDGILLQNCDCSSEAGKQEKTDRGNNETIPYPRVKRCYPGEWKKSRGDAFCSASGGYALRCMYFTKKYTTTEDKITYLAEHKCGKTCPSVPWGGKAVDVQNELKDLCKGWT